MVVAGEQWRTAVSDVVATVDRMLYAAFGEPTEHGRLASAREDFRGARTSISFDVFAARVRATAIVLGIGVGTLAAILVLALPAPTYSVLARPIARLLSVGTPLPRPAIAGTVGLVTMVLANRGVILAVTAGLGMLARARKDAIERTLPAAVRYLAVLASGTTDERDLLERVAARTEVYGETATAFRRVLNRAELTGSLDAAARSVARDTPSRDLLAPFLLKLREHAGQGPDALRNYLRLEARMLAHRQARARDRAEGFLELVAELFVVLLVLPALLVIVVTVLGVLAPGFGTPISTPLGDTTMRAVLVYGSAAFVVVIGLLAASLVGELRPAGYGWATHERSASPADIVRNAPMNPADALPFALGFGVIVGVVLWSAGQPQVVVVLLSYVAFGLPVGSVAARRARLDDAKDREVKDFIHAVSGHVSLGRPFPDAVEDVARDVDLGPLADDVADLAFNLRVTTHGTDSKTAALSRFVDRVGTPLAGQTIGLVTGALDAGSDADAAFDALQSEVGKLLHQKQALRSGLLVYVVVGWTTALLVVGITVAVNASVLEGFAQLSAVSQSSGTMGFDPNAIDLQRDRFRFYVVTQATMLACGWFAGAASRGKYDALLHSGGLVLAAHLIYVVAGFV